MGNVIEFLLPEILVHHLNTEFTSVEDYFKKTVIIPFLDHIISNLSYKFDSHMKKAALIHLLT